MRPEAPISARTLGQVTFPCGVRGIAFVDQVTRVLATTSCANEYLHFDIKGWNLWLHAFEEQHTVAMFAVRGWQRLNKVAHMLPSIRQTSQERGGRLRGSVVSVMVPYGSANREHYGSYRRMPCAVAEREQKETTPTPPPCLDHLCECSWAVLVCLYP